MSEDPDVTVDSPRVEGPAQPWWVWAPVAAGWIALLAVLELVRQHLSGELDQYIFRSSGVGPDGLLVFSDVNGNPPGLVTRWEGIWDSDVVPPMLAAAGLAVLFLAVVVRTGTVAHPATRLVGSALAAATALIGLVSLIGAAVMTIATSDDVNAMYWTSPALRVLPGAMVLLVVVVVTTVSGWLVHSAPSVTSDVGDAGNADDGAGDDRSAADDRRPEDPDRPVAAPAPPVDVKPTPVEPARPAWDYDPADYRRPA